MERIIAIKKQLGVLFKHGKDELLTEYDIDVIDDILSVYDGQGKSFHYDKNNVLSQSVQETLFNEKRTIIENCLFGVDLNSKAVAICQLRLWIELLKNAYYKNEVMETLPNIDINIKSGNSLINKLNFAIGSKIGQGGVELEKNTQKLINQYKKLVAAYRGVSDKSVKAEIRKNIESIKANLHSIYNQISFSVNKNMEIVFDYGSDSYKFSVRIHRDKYVDDNNEAMFISYDEIKAIDNKYLSIPLIRQHELSIFLKMTNECKRMSEISKCYTGEIDISLHSEFITNSSSDHSMLRGAQVQKYYITNDISQGDILFLKADGYLDKNKGEKSQHHNRRRIVMQGITGVNEKWRLKMTMAQPPYFCANSVNYLIPDMTDDFDYFILGILNSKLLNWYFAKLSTNSNVNGYEIDGLPIKMGTVEQRNEIIQLVGELLQSYDEIKVKEIDDIVYQIYGITEYEKPIIEG